MATQADRADPVRDLCDALAAYLPRLAELLPEPDSPAGYADTGMTGALAHSPVPGNPAAFYAATGIHGLARWWEAMLLYHHGAADPWGRRGGRDEGTLAALERIAALAAGADDDVTGMLLAELGQAETEAARHPAIDVAVQWRYVRGRACPYCECRVTLKVLLDGRGQPLKPVRIECFAGPRADGTRCTDADGRRPAATIEADDRGVPWLVWKDGRRETVPDLED